MDKPDLDQEIRKGKRRNNIRDFRSREESSHLASLVISFLEGQGFEVYRMQSVQEAYQIKGDSEVLRLYITRKA